ncbi:MULTISPECIES: serine O-acetyltransferase [Flectobacillus]|jgi:serine O-acetyltransferase|uniref:Serine acetyltransferase n=1 Tax=Flectobacillus roseus TaxID=502259 RepID=A0ABT6YB45_9BACT|nr:MULTISPECIES: serine acetyltransferase [Flectobacillus]MDI9860808.1 serine acetyltransferase [Flectobacillus roseus]MDI9871428.1 serine acetyltransferase [Flectobacillus roseus]NBA76024.1 serine acetyltransferase [Emticicia sp. ODNR4P]PAC32878.1 serine acetyltransferase [Flectobacillus sp. BAB-3569]
MLPKDFLEALSQKHTKSNTFPSTSAVKELFTDIMLTLFPEQTQRHYGCLDELQEAFDQIELRLTRLLRSMQKHLDEDARILATNYIQKLPEIYRVLLTDVQATLLGDPAAQSEYEVIRAYPGFYAIAFYRLAHALYEMNVPMLPRILTEYAHSKTGIDIHPGADIDEYFMIDHGTGVVVGETTTIGKHVKLYQGVTLGALSVSKEMASLKRHPTIEDHVVIYSGATILGGETVVGAHSIIGGNVWLTRSVPPQTKIYHQEQVKILN